MKSIGLLSDSHGHIDDAVYAFFDKVDEIWHAGDFGNLATADTLASFKPLKGVYGNIDDSKLRVVYPENLRFYCEEVDVYMTHIGGYPGRYEKRVYPELISNPPKLFITGHSHILKVMYDKKLGFLHINPGAAGKYGFHSKITLIRFKIDKENITDLEIYERDRNK